MSRMTFHQWAQKLVRRRPNTRKKRILTRTRTFEQLGERVVLSVTATFVPGAGALSIFGDNLDNNIAVSRDAAGNILINGGAVAINGGSANGRQYCADPGIRASWQRPNRTGRGEWRTSKGESVWRRRQ